MRFRLTLDIERSRTRDSYRESDVASYVSEQPDNVRYIGFQRTDEIEVDQ